MKTSTLLTILIIASYSFASVGYDPKNPKHLRAIDKACATKNIKDLEKWKRKGWDPLNHVVWGSRKKAESNNPLYNLDLYSKYNEQKHYDNCTAYLVSQGADPNEGIERFLRAASGKWYTATPAMFLSNGTSIEDAKKIAALAKNGVDINEYLKWDGSKTTVTFSTLLGTLNDEVEIVKILMKAGGNPFIFGKGQIVHKLDITGRDKMSAYLKSIPE